MGKRNPGRPRKRVVDLEWFLKKYDRLFHKWAMKWNRGRLDEDYLSSVLMGVVEAHRRYSPKKNKAKKGEVGLLAYAKYWSHMYCIREYRRRKCLGLHVPHSVTTGDVKVTQINFGDRDKNSRRKLSDEMPDHQSEIDYEFPIPLEEDQKSEGSDLLAGDDPRFRRILVTLFNSGWERTLIRLLFLEELSYQKIGDLLGVSKQWVGTKVRELMEEARKRAAENHGTEYSEYLDESEISGSKVLPKEGHKKPRQLWTPGDIGRRPGSRKERAGVNGVAGSFTPTAPPEASGNHLPGDSKGELEAGGEKVDESGGGNPGRTPTATRGDAVAGQQGPNHQLRNPPGTEGDHEGSDDVVAGVVRAKARDGNRGRKPGGQKSPNGPV